MKAINDKGLERIELNLPQYSEQKKIVNELDKITLAINNRKNNNSCLLLTKYQFPIWIQKRKYKIS